MNGQRSSEYLEGLLHELRALPGETEWLEFKESYAEPQDIGEYISALANSAALAGKAAAYLVWGYVIVTTPSSEPRSNLKQPERETRN